MSDPDVGIGEMHGWSDGEVEEVLQGRPVLGAGDTAAFVNDLRRAYAAEAVPAPTMALSELFTRGLSVDDNAAPAASARRTQMPAPIVAAAARIRGLGTAAKAALAGLLIVGSSTALAAADVLPQPVDDTVSAVVPFVDTDEDDTAEDPETPDTSEDADDAADAADRDADAADDAVDDADHAADDDADHADDAADDDADDADDAGEHAEPPSPSPSTSGDGDDDRDASTPTTIDDDRDASTPTTIDDDNDVSTPTTLDDDSDASTPTTVEDGDDASGEGGHSGGSSSVED